jgi:hypothetical protein
MKKINFKNLIFLLFKDKSIKTAVNLFKRKIFNNLLIYSKINSPITFLKKAVSI